MKIIYHRYVRHDSQRMLKAWCKRVNCGREFAIAIGRHLHVWLVSETEGKQ